MTSVAPWLEPPIIRHAQQLLHSYRHWTGGELVSLPTGVSPRQQATAVYEATIPVLAHGTGRNPLCTYGNRTALELFELDWAALVRLPSNRTAEAAARSERSAALRRVAEAGYLTGYRGIRVARSGRRFGVDQGRIWTVLDEVGRSVGQAATFVPAPPW
jgi:hypothetical protein